VTVTVPDPPQPSPATQRVARIVMITALLLAGLWTLHRFLDALAWATVFAIALWPLNRRLIAVFPEPRMPVIAPAVLTAAIAVVFIVPLVLLGIAVAHEAHFVMRFVAEARLHGLATPDWLAEIPLVGAAATGWWQTNLGDPETVDALLGRIGTRALSGSAREYAGEVIHRVILFFFTLLTVFFLFRHGHDVAARLRGLSDRLLGERGEQIAEHMMAAVHGTVTGLVLVGLGEGLLLGIVYVAVGLPYAASLGMLTGVAAIIPFAAPVAYCLCALYLFAGGNTVGGIVIVIAGSVIVFIADHFVRPVLIGGAVRLPFLWVLLGILGGLESFGFLGLFVGPAVMAALIALWREWTDPPQERLPQRSARRVPVMRSRRPRRA
jgi:predicted PurR-regulated permease PerM